MTDRDALTACNCGPRECIHPTNLRPGFQCKVQLSALAVSPEPHELEKRLFDVYEPHDLAWKLQFMAKYPDGLDPIIAAIRIKLLRDALAVSVEGRTPDLLEAAKHAAMEWRLHGQLTDSCRVLEAAIAKTEAHSSTPDAPKEPRP